MTRRREQLPDTLEFDDKYILKREIQTPRQGIHDEVYQVILKGELNTSIEFRKAKARYEREVLAKRTKYSFEPVAILQPISDADTMMISKLIVVRSKCLVRIEVMRKTQHKHFLNVTYIYECIIVSASNVVFFIRKYIR